MFMLSQVNGFKAMKHVMRFGQKLVTPKSQFALRDLSTQPFWLSQGLKFKCTGCGKCCQNDGDGWVDVDEFVDLMNYLQKSPEDILDHYFELPLSGWAKLKSVPVNKETIENKKAKDQCIFLDEKGKKCTIYEVRPMQCRTYPYWKDVIVSEKEWLNEAVVPDHLIGKHWSSHLGGCEGINHSEGLQIPQETIHQNNQLYKIYNLRFPTHQTQDDRSRFLTMVDIKQTVLDITKKWINQFVIKYNLCPFAQPVVKANQVRYRVILEEDQEKILERIKLEILYMLLNTKDIETTILCFPYAMEDFQEFHAFSEELQDQYFPKIMDDCDPKLYYSSSINKNKTTTNSDKLPFQLAFFHPSFSWASDNNQTDQAIDFEKRSPFPMINILRTSSIDQLANDKTSQKIADHNFQKLNQLGVPKLMEIMNDLIPDSSDCIEYDIEVEEEEVDVEQNKRSS